jgi:hypothetical protein
MLRELRRVASTFEADAGVRLGGFKTIMEEFVVPVYDTMLFDTSLFEQPNIYGQYPCG